MNKLKLTVEEAISHCIQLGTPNGESLLKTFTRRGRFDSSDSYDSLIKNLETEYECATYSENPKGKILTGKKRRILLGNRKQKTTKKENNSKGNQMSKKENETVKIYVFQKLLELEAKYRNKKMGLSLWCDIIELYSLDDVDIREVEDLYKDYYYQKDLNKVATAAIRRINSVSVNTIGLALDHLENEGRIQREYGYFKKKADISTNIDKNEYDEITKSIAYTVELNKMSYSSYTAIKLGRHEPNEQYREIVKKVNEMLLDAFNINMIYTAFSINITDDNEMKWISKKEAQQALFNKISILESKDFIKQQSKERTGFVHKEFKSFNVILMLYKILLAEGLENQLVECEPTDEEIEEVNAIKRDFAIAKSAMERIEHNAF